MIYPSYFYDIKLPGFPGNKKYQKELKETQKDFLNKIILSKKMHPGAKKICLKCFSPIFEVGGKCPNGCEDE